MHRLRFFALVTIFLAVLLPSGRGYAAGEIPPLPEQDWSFSGIFGTYDPQTLQRGFLVYKQVCSSCHSMDLLAYRHLEALGYSEEQVRAIASQYVVTDGPNDQGEMFERPARPSDRFAAPFPNDAAARAANGGALPPDMSVLAQARTGGADYIYALLIGYEEPPPDVELMPGMHWNEYFPGHQIAMPNMLADGGVDYADGTEATVEQQAYDVAAFLMWAAEPHLDERKQMGVKVVLFLVVFTGLMYAVKRRVWADVH